MTLTLLLPNIYSLPASFWLVLLQPWSFSYILRWTHLFHGRYDFILFPLSSIAPFCTALFPTTDPLRSINWSSSWQRTVCMEERIWDKNITLEGGNFPFRWHAPNTLKSYICSREKSVTDASWETLLTSKSSRGHIGLRPPHYDTYYCQCNTSESSTSSTDPLK